MIRLLIALSTLIGGWNLALATDFQVKPICFQVESYATAASARPSSSNPPKVLFNGAAVGIQPIEGRCSGDSCVSEACFKSDAVKLDRANEVKLSISHVGEPGRESVHKLFVVTHGKRPTFICESVFNNPARQGNSCSSSVRLRLEDIDPELASKVAHLTNRLQVLSDWIDQNATTASDYAELLEFVAQKIAELSGKPLDQITDADFAAFKGELADAMQHLRNLSTDVNQLRGEVSDRKTEVSEAIERISEDARALSELTNPTDEFDIDVEIVFEELEPFDTGLDEEQEADLQAYENFKSETIRTIDGFWSANNRRGILGFTRGWALTVQAMYDALIGKPDQQAAAEREALGSAIIAVESHLYNEGCGGRGCLDKSTLFFPDSPISPAVQQALLEFKRLINGLSELSQAMDAINEEAYQTILDEIRLWPRPLSDSRKQYLAAFENHVKTLTGLEAYIKLRKAEKPVETSSVAEVARAMREASVVLMNAAFSLTSTAAGFIPGLGDAIDFCEASTGNEGCVETGRTLSISERVLAGIATSLPGLSRKTLQIIGDAADSPGAKEVVLQIGRIADSAKDNIPQLRNTVEFLKRGDIPTAKRREVIEAFTENSKVVTLTEDTTVYRYWVEGFNGPKGHWVTRKKVSNPHSELALPHAGPYKEASWTLPKGTEVLEGMAAPNFKQPGGAAQIFLPNPGVLK